MQIASEALTWHAHNAIFGVMEMKEQEFRAILKELGLSQPKLARTIGVDVTTVNRWATGKTRIQEGAAAYLRLLKEVRKTGRIDQ